MRKKLTVETRVLSSGYQIVDTMTQFMEQGDDFVMLQETRLLRRRLREVAHQGCGWIAALAVLINVALLDMSVYLRKMVIVRI